MNKKIFLLFIILLLIVSCDKFFNNKKSEIEYKDIFEKNKFVGKNVEDVKKLVIEKSEKNGLKLTDFQTINFEQNRFYLYSYVIADNPIIYYIEYQNIDEAHSLVARISNINNENLDIVKDVIVNLIECTDTNITKMMAEDIFTELITKISEQSFSSFLLNNNNLSYGMQVEIETGDLIFVAMP